MNAAKLRELADGGYTDRAEPVLPIGDCGTGKTHLLTGLCVAACRQRRRVHFTTAAALVNELVEAKHQLQLRRVMARWTRYDLIAIDEVGYVPLAEVGAEFLFQVIAERANHRPGAHSGDRHGILPFSPNYGKAAERRTRNRKVAVERCPRHDLFSTLHPTFNTWHVPGYYTLVTCI